MTYPLALYREGDSPNAFKWDGRMTEMVAVESAEEHEIALSEGWAEASDYVGGSSLSLLDHTAKEISEALPELTLDELEALKADEIAGKARKGVLASIDEAIDKKLKD